MEWRRELLLGGIVQVMVWVRLGTRRRQRCDAPVLLTRPLEAVSPPLPSDL